MEVFVPLWGVKFVDDAVERALLMYGFSGVDWDEIYAVLFCVFKEGGLDAAFDFLGLESIPHTVPLG